MSRVVIVTVMCPSRRVDLSWDIWDRWMLKSLKTNTLVDGLIERTSSMLDEITSKAVLREEDDAS